MHPKEEIDATPELDDPDRLAGFSKRPNTWKAT
jgi:hypothetical protein